MAIGPVSSSQPFNVVPSAYQEGDVMAGFKQNNEEQKAIAFQKWLSKGVDGMNVVYAELPDEVKQSVVDPNQLAGFMGKPEGQDMYLNWYKTVNAAISKSNIRTAAESGNYSDVLKFKASAPDATSQDAENLYGNQKIGEFFKNYNPKVEEASPTKSYDVQPKGLEQIFQDIESGGKPGVIHPMAKGDESFISKMKRGNIALGRYGITGQWFKKAGIPEPTPEEFKALEAMEKASPGSVEAALSSKDINSLPQNIKDSLPKSYVDFLTSDDLQKQAFSTVLKDYIAKATDDEGNVDYRKLGMLYSSGGTNPDKVMATRDGKPYTAGQYADDFVERINRASGDPNFVPYDLVEKEAKKAWRNKTRGEHLTEAYKFDQSPVFLQAMEKYAQALPMDKVFDPNSDAKLAMAKQKMSAKAAKDASDAEFKKKKLAFESISKYVKTAEEAVQKANLIKPVLEYVENNKDIPGIGAFKKPFRDLIVMGDEEFSRLKGDEKALQKLSEFRAKLNAGFGALMRLQGGKTITESELKMFEKEFALGTTNTPEDFANALKYIYDLNQARAQSLWNTFQPFTDGHKPQGDVAPPEDLKTKREAGATAKAADKVDKLKSIIESVISARDTTKQGK